MKKDFAFELARKFAPTYWVSRGEDCHLVELKPEHKPRIHKRYSPRTPFIYFSADQLKPLGTYTAYEINYLTIWDQDTGLFGHLWDTERTAILVVGPKRGNPDAFSARESYYAAHEGWSFLRNYSGFHRCSLENCGVTVYWSKGKHASYRHPDDCITLLEKFKRPGYEVNPEEYILSDVGTLENPKVPWILYRSDWTENKVESIYRKLRTRLWSRKTWCKIEKDRETEVQMREFQRREGIPVTGKMDEDTLNRIRTKSPDPHLIRNIDKIKERDYKNMLHSRIRGSDIDFIVRKKLSSGQISEVVQRGLHGRTLRGYVRGKAGKIKKI